MRARNVHMNSCADTRQGMSSQHQDCSQESEMVPAENDWNYGLKGYPTSRKKCHMLTNNYVWASSVMEAEELC